MRGLVVPRPVRLAGFRRRNHMHQARRIPRSASSLATTSSLRMCALLMCSIVTPRLRRQAGCPLTDAIAQRHGECRVVEPAMRLFTHPRPVQPGTEPPGVRSPSIGTSDIAHGRPLQPFGYHRLSEGAASLGYGDAGVGLWIGVAKRPVPAGRGIRTALLLHGADTQSIDAFHAVASAPWRAR